MYSHLFLPGLSSLGDQLFQCLLLTIQFSSVFLWREEQGTNIIYHKGLSTSIKMTKND